MFFYNKIVELQKKNQNLKTEFIAAVNEFKVWKKFMNFFSFVGNYLKVD